MNDQPHQTLYSLEEWLAATPPLKREIYKQGMYRAQDLRGYLKTVLSNSLTFDPQRLGVFGNHLTLLHALAALDKVSSPDQIIELCSVLDEIWIVHPHTDVTSIYHFQPLPDNAALYLEHSAVVHQLMEFAACVCAAEPTPTMETWWMRCRDQWPLSKPSEKSLYHYRCYRELIDTRPALYFNNQDWTQCFLQWKMSLLYQTNNTLSLPEIVNEI